MQMANTATNGASNKRTEKQKQQSQPKRNQSTRPSRKSKSRRDPATRRQSARVRTPSLDVGRYNEQAMEPTVATILSFKLECGQISEEEYEHILKVAAQAQLRQSESEKTNALLLQRRSKPHRKRRKSRMPEQCRHWCEQLPVSPQPLADA